MLIRLIVLQQQEQLSNIQWKAISVLESHKESLTTSEMLDLSTINTDIRHARDLTKDERSESEIQDLYWRINFNQHSVDTPLEPQRGSCLALGATMINHSCDPNPHHLSEGSDLVIRSVRKLAKDEEITISYIDTTQSFEKRQEVLSTSYAFGCQCSRCVKGFDDESEILTGNSIIDAPIRDAQSRLQALLDALANGTKELESAESKIREICNAVSAGKGWLISASPLPKLYQVLAKRLEDEQQWDKALRVWLKIVYIIDPLCYPERVNPHRVEHLMALCQVEG
ncbi:MAG: hypothetical protein Q9214_001685, partial [Letrouitia sp. 1 TL-2023]